jgi:hypothetical protein
MRTPPQTTISATTGPTAQPTSQPIAQLPSQPTSQPASTDNEPGNFKQRMDTCFAFDWNTPLKLWFSAGKPNAVETAYLEAYLRDVRDST